MNVQYANLFFGADTRSVDPLVDSLTLLEEERQKRRIILIPSESYAPLPVRQALGSVFTNIYAEGYPPSQMVDNDEELLADLAQQLAYYRRYADRRFYKGADYVHFIETLAQRRAAACFANDLVSPEEIYVNVQPLSGAAANLAVYDALMEPGDTLMGMDLFQGGHLTHGSEFNVSGKRYEVVSYGVSQRDSRLDYDEIRKMAEAHRPKVIVAGYTSYPWAPDFSRFREIADAVGAYLVADISHPAGMVIAGVYPSPVGIADVVTFTTHKTLCGPRAACVLTTDNDLAREIDMAVFPGMQGGPHTNKFAAMCVAFEIARTDAFKDLQRRIVANAQALAKGLTDRGLELAYGGTDTHLLLLDLKSVQQGKGAKNALYGEVVARILELAGVVVNKNTIPGDTITALATGIRMGTPWVTQRGMEPQEMDTLADCISRVVYGIEPFTYQGLLGLLPRGKIDLDTLEEVKWGVDELACVAQAEIECGCSTYPHYCLRPREPDPVVPLFAADAEEQDLAEGAVLVDLSDEAIIRVSGWRALPFLDDLCTADVSAVDVNRSGRTFLLDEGGQVIDDLTLWRLPRDKRGRDHYVVFTNPENTDYAVSWLRGVSDGYVLFDDEDVTRKVRGPAKVEVVSDPEGSERMATIALCGPQAGQALGKLLGTTLPDDSSAITEARYGLHAFSLSWDGYGEGDGTRVCRIIGSVPGVRALWDALSEAGAKPAKAPEARHRLREAAGLPAVWATRHPEPRPERAPEAYMDRLPAMFEMHKPYFVGQNKLPAPEVVETKETFTWQEPAGTPGPTGAPHLRTPLYDAHVELNAKIVPFAGWDMPVWYTSVGDEHRAVRETAGLFDVAHMGTLEIGGPYAADFLDLVSVNYARWLKDGESQYGAFLDAEGRILDDIFVYRRAWDCFFLVVNAANFDKDWAWLNAVSNNEVVVDSERPWVGVLHPATLRNLKDDACGPDQRVDIALQGPNSLQILLACTGDLATRSKLNRLQRTKFVEAPLGGIDLLIARTGYTGEDVGFEMYVHPDRATDLWSLLLEKGKTFGILPCGLAARDSTRIEAGLPLYGHELAGPSEVTQSEAGFAAYVKYHKPFFVGRTPYKAYTDQSTRRIARFHVTERGARALRGGEPVANRRGKVIGTVTSCTLVGERQIGMVLVSERYAEEGTDLFVYPKSRKTVSKPPQQLGMGDTVPIPIHAVVLPRFPER